ncbi:hypothetical protein ACOBQB_28035 [Streptomyces sp. G5(2025)]|uniref:hypothetical protein n=1 Tax=Streptomyces sp. G5(2025) TaxID=3406628 RepID=UPI003C19EBA3
MRTGSRSPAAAPARGAKMPEAVPGRPGIEPAFTKVTVGSATFYDLARPKKQKK